MAISAPANIVDGIRAAPRATVTFWRAQGEALGLSVAAYLLAYALAWVWDAPLAEVVSFASLGVYVWVVWRLKPGSGGWLYRGARIVGWALLAGLIGGGASWLLVTLVPFPRPMFGMDGQDFALSPLVSLVTSVVLVTPLAVMTRVLQRAIRAARERLRWQLVVSYLAISAVAALLVYLVLGLYVGIVSLSLTPTLIEPALAAERSVTAIEPLIRADADEAALRDALAGIRDGTTRIPLEIGAGLTDSANQPALDGLRRLTIIRRVAAGYAVAASTPSEPPAEVLASLAAVAAQAETGRCVSGRPAGGTLADTGICPIRDARGVVVALLLVETDYSRPGAQAGAAIGRVIGVTTTFFAAAAVSLLLASMVMILFAGGIGDLLARRITRRLERLTDAAGALAAGDLERRIMVDRDDEIGRLGADFNLMATRLAEREQALLIEKERVERLLDGNRRLVANVSHELRTPLATLRGYLEALEQSHGAQLPQHDLRVIQNEVQRLTGLIDDLFTLARAEQQRLPLAMTVVDIAELVGELAATLAPLARRERAVEVIAALPSDLPPVYADRARLAQVLLNLAQNALRHTPEGGIVAFAAEAGAQIVTIAVADTGIGIPAEELALVFERFYRGDASRTRETGGAGLGLALVRELVVAMGGTVDVTSIVGQGSRFSIQLPRAQSPETDGKRS